MIAIPIAFQNLISFGVSMLDSIMLGALGDIPLSASSLANQKASLSFYASGDACAATVSSMVQLG